MESGSHLMHEPPKCGPDPIFVFGFTDDPGPFPAENPQTLTYNNACGVMIRYIPPNAMPHGYCAIGSACHVFAT
jgi:hypothetical protein